MRKGWPDLPPLLAEIAEIAGIDAALKIAELRGGQTVFFASRLSDHNWLVRAIGRERAEKLSQHFCSGRGRLKIDMPLGPTGSYAALRRRTAAIVAEEAAKGGSENATARRAGVTNRTVRRHRARIRAGAAPKHQLKLI